MIKKILLLALCGGLLQTQIAVAEPKNDAIKALTNYAVVLALWNIEHRCNQMPSGMRKEFDTIVVNAGARLKDIFEPRFFNAAWESGKETANSPQYAACDKATRELLDGRLLDMARELKTTLDKLPVGYKLKVTN